MSTSTIASKRRVRTRKRSTKSNSVAKRGAKPGSIPSVRRKGERFGTYLEEARSLGLLDAKTIGVSVRVPSNLLRTARSRAGVRSSAKLVIIALALVALHDDFGRQLLRHKGTVDPDVDLEF
jgi:hypothetical protein